MHTVSAGQQRELREQLQDARRRRDAAAVRLTCQRLDNLYVRQAHRRAAGPEVRRLRRLLRERAA